VDEEGLEALSMRRLGAELGGFEAMSLYKHLANKAEVLDGIVEAVWREMRLPSEDLDCWERLAELARSWRELGHSHPNVFPMLANRAVHSPDAMRPVEFALKALQEAGFRGQATAAAFRTLLACVYGHTSLELLRTASAGEQGSRREPWYDVSRVPTQFALIVQLAEHFTGHDDPSFEWGVESTLTGLRVKARDSRRPERRIQAKARMSS
jgi:AcrR family transcriptional regulator